MINMQIKESIGRLFSKRGNAISIKSIFDGGKSESGWLRNHNGLKEALIPKKFGGSISKEGVVDNPKNFDILWGTYTRIPKVFRAINMRAAFAIQGGFKLIGNEADVKKLLNWHRKEFIENKMITQAQEAIIFGDVYNEIVGSGENTTIPFLPVEMIRVIREEIEGKDGKPYFTHVTKRYIQVSDNGIELNDWEPDEMAHFKWNGSGTSAYGFSDITPALTNLTDKLDMEAVIPRIGKFLYPKVIFKCGRPETPYNNTQLQAFKDDLENMVVGGDVIVAGDIDTEVVMPMAGSEVIVRLLAHIENQVDISLNSPFDLGDGDGQASLVRMDAIERDVKTIQDMLSMVYEQKIYPKVLGKSDVPIIKWNAMNVETALRTSRTLRQLLGKKSERPIITIDEARTELGMAPINMEELQTILDMEKKSDSGGKDEPNEQIPGD